nr:MAG TPA: hypothetical protein [Caudoviricetes sp.]
MRFHYFRKAGLRFRFFLLFKYTKSLLVTNFFVYLQCHNKRG